MDAEQWMQELAMLDKVRHDVLDKEKAEAAKQERTRQEAENKAWLRELGRKA
jgi:hypothetical protein